MKLHLGSKEKAAETATPALDAELGTAETVKKRSERPKRRKRLSRRERLMLLIPAVAAVVAVAVVAFTLDRGSTYTMRAMLPLSRAAQSSSAAKRGRRFW